MSHSTVRYSCSGPAGSPSLLGSRLHDSAGPRLLRRLGPVTDRPARRAGPAHPIRSEKPCISKSGGR
eukprot:737648-Hanusia_phi.AAC.1